MTRAELAALEALAELIADGLVIPVGTTRPSGSSHRIKWHYRGQSSGFEIPAIVPDIGSTEYRLRRRLRADADGVFPSADLLGLELVALTLPRRAERCLVEAVSSFRRGLFLACGALLGAASEGAWRAAGEALRVADPKVAEALDAVPARTAQLQVRVLDAFRRAKCRDTVLNELSSRAEIYRALRDYGVHPSLEPDPTIEQYLTEEGCGLLLLTMHRYLVALDTCAARTAGSAPRKSEP